MLYRKWFIMLTGVLFLLGCSGNVSTTTPGIDIGASGNALHDTVGLMVEDIDESGKPSAGAGMLGMFQAKIDLANLDGELTALRNAALDDALEMVDITNFLTMAPCSDCAKIMGIEINADNQLVVSIGIKHPFDAGEPLKPISGRNRADLHVFNIEGTVVFEDSTNNSPFDSIDETIGPGYLLNADGYSPYLDIPIDDIFNTTATLHPYILHLDDYTAGNFNPATATGFESVVDPPPSGNLVMAMGCDYDIQDYVFDISDDESFEFIYAVGCTYAITVESYSYRFQPEYQIPQHNKKAASEVSVEFVSNNLIPGDPLSSAELQISVLDINHGIPVGGGLDEMAADSSVSEILVEVPGVINGTVSGSTIPTGGNGRDPSDPLTFSVTFNNDNSAGYGVYTGLVKVVDAYPTGLNTLPSIIGYDAVGRVDPTVMPFQALYTLDEFATYMVFETTISTDCGPIIEGSFTSLVACEDAVIGDIEIISGESVTFSATGFSSYNASVFYDWDFGDGSPHDTSGPDVNHAYTNLNCGGTNADEIYVLVLTVTDDCSPPNTPVVQTINITVVCPRTNMTLSPSAEALVPNYDPHAGPWDHFYSPALSQDDDGELRMVAYMIENAQRPGWSWLGGFDTSDGFNWSSCGNITSTNAVPPYDVPIKATPNKGSNNSYAAFHMSTSGQKVATMSCRWEQPYYYTPLYPSPNNREYFSNRTTGYFFYFTAPENRIRLQRSTSPNNRNLAYLCSFANGESPHLSFTRSCAEDESTGLMYLVYYSYNEDVIRLATSNSSDGDSWILTTIYEDTTGTYDTIVNPTIDIDIDNRMHISYLRHHITNDTTELVYMHSVDLGQTFCMDKVIDTGTLMSEPTIEVFDYLDHDWVAICYEKDGHIYLALSEDQGHSFGHMMQISEQAPPNCEPDIIMTTNGWLQFVWTNGTPMTDGQLYARKIDLS